MTELSPAGQAIIASAKAICISQWENVDDPPCHPEDDQWYGCDICVKRSGVAAALRIAADHVASEGEARRLILSMANEIQYADRLLSNITEDNDGNA